MFSLKTKSVLSAVFLLTLSAFQTSAQAKKNQRNESPSKADVPQKRNTRDVATENPQKAHSTVIEQVTDSSAYQYEFSQPQFLFEKINIEHDDKGRGKITYLKKNQDEITENLIISAQTLSKLKGYFAELSFLESSETYQSSERQYPHLGTMKIGLKTKEKSREVEFNWTENKTAEALANEYRKIAEQAIWVFETDVARESQPLQTPKQIDALESLLRRDMIADFVQIEPFLKELANDERLPLIARNRLIHIIKAQKSKK